MEIICNVKSTERFSSLNYIVSVHMTSSILSQLESRASCRLFTPGKKITWI